MRSVIVCVALLPSLGAHGASQLARPDSSKGRIAVIVRIQDGRGVSDAKLALLAGPTGPGPHPIVRTSSTDHEGRYLFADVPAGQYAVRAEATGFLAATTEVTVIPDTVASAELELKVLSLSQTVVVSETHTSQQLTDLPAQITVLSAEEISQSTALTLDDLLKQVPSFSLFRRSSSLVSQPTTQGVSLRGIGASGVSRTLVLLDGVPFNDPVGSWVYWSRIPRLEIEKIEVDEGGVSSLYGSSAMAGVIEIATRQPSAPTFEVEGLIGTRGTVDVDFFAGDRRGPISYRSGGTLFRTAGYKTVPEVFRGPVDINATSQHETLDGRIAYHPSNVAQFFVGGAFFNEVRGNGTPLQNNSTRASSLHAGLRAHTNDGSDWQANFFAFTQRFRSTFSSIALNRASERLSLRQDEPAHGIGGNVQWSRLLPGSQLLAIGVDGRETYARNQENVFPTPPAGAMSRQIPANQAFLGAFFQDFWTPWRRLNILFGARLDYWKNYGASQTVIAASATRTTLYRNSSNTTITPRAGLVFRATGSLSLRAAFYQGFRAPTLDELYRSFRVGNIVTNANPALGPERVIGYEFGMNYQITPTLFWRLTVFNDRLNNPVSNITVSNTGDVIMRQRENLGNVNIKGVEAEVDYRVLPKWKVQGRYLFDQARVGSFPANPSIVGNLLPQVPKHRASALVSRFRPSLFDVALETRFESSRFDDDRNTLNLGRYFVLNLGLSRVIGEHWKAFVNIENVLNYKYAVQATPIKQIGTPLLITGGVRFRLF